MSLAFTIPCMGRHSVTALCLDRLAQMDDIQSVTVYVSDAGDVTLWEDPACKSALYALGESCDLRYSHTTPSGPGADRLKPLERALSDGYGVIVSMDSDALLPPSFIRETRANIAAAPDGWGFIGYPDRDALSPSLAQELWQDAGAYNDRLSRCNSAAGVCIVFNGLALREIAETVFPLVRYYSFAEDGFLCLPIASRRACFVAKSPQVVHCRDRNASRTSIAKLALTEETTVLATLAERGLLSAEVSEWFQSCMRDNGWRGDCNVSVRAGANTTSEICTNPPGNGRAICPRGPRLDLAHRESGSRAAGMEAGGSDGRSTWPAIAA